MSRIVVAGASGPIGQSLVAALRSDDPAVTTLVRHPPRGATQVRRNPDAGE